MYPDMRIDGRFHNSYRQLEDRMKARAEADGDIFLPNPEPSGPVEYVLICMEPSLGWWARSAEEARSRVEAGFRNFLFSIEVIILHYCVRRYLCGSGQTYHITDLSKGAMLVNRADDERDQRYERWYELLQQEIDLCATPTARIIAVGNVVAHQLERQGFKRSFRQIIHYSTQAVSARSARIVGREESFQAFKDSVSLEDLVATAEDVFKAAQVPPYIRDNGLARLRKNQLTTSRQQLIFIYKEEFESMHSS